MSKMDGSYQRSEVFMNTKHQAKDGFTFNIDESGPDINVSVRHVNRKDGNSDKHTHPIALTEGPCCECYKNEAQTIFNKDYSTGNFLQAMFS